MPSIRFATEEDLPGICDLVNHYILHSAIHWDSEPWPVEEWRRQWRAGRERYPWLVAHTARGLAGVAYGSPFKTRAAYAWSAQCTIYLAPQSIGQGIGKALYGKLFQLMDAQGFSTIIAGVALPNDASLAIHRSFGFEPVAHYRRVGWKHGQWMDLVDLQRMGPQAAEQPEPPRAVSAVAHLVSSPAAPPAP